jgi:hypothetical protein
MTEQTVAWIMMGVGTALILFLMAMLTTLRDDSLSKSSARPPRSEGWFHPLAAAQNLGVTLMAALDAALARFTAFVKGVVSQVTAAKDINDAQTVKLTELQVALDAALADDAADKASIANLQGEIANLQSAVADQINAALDSLENPPVEVVEEVVVEEPVEVVEVVEEEVVVPVEVVEEEVVAVEPVTDETVL